MGLPLARLALLGYATPTEAGVEAIRTAYQSWCEFAGVDVTTEYPNLEALLDESKFSEMERSIGD